MDETQSQDNRCERSKHQIIAIHLSKFFIKTSLYQTTLAAYKSNTLKTEISNKQNIVERQIVFSHQSY